MVWDFVLKIEFFEVIDNEGIIDVVLCGLFGVGKLIVICGFFCSGCVGKIFVLGIVVVEIVVNG